MQHRRVVAVDRHGSFSGIELRAALAQPLAHAGIESGRPKRGNTSGVMNAAISSISPSRTVSTFKCCGTNTGRSATGGNPGNGSGAHGKEGVSGRVRERLGRSPRLGAPPALRPPAVAPRRL